MSRNSSNREKNNKNQGPIDWMSKPINWEPHHGCLSTAGVNSHKTKTPNAQPEVQSEATTPSTEHCGPSPEQAVWPWEPQKLHQTRNQPQLGLSSSSVSPSASHQDSSLTSGGNNCSRQRGRSWDCNGSNQTAQQRCIVERTGAPR